VFMRQTARKKSDTAFCVTDITNKEFSVYYTYSRTQKYFI